MTTLQALPLGQDWKERLSLSKRQAPEFYETPEAVTDSPHAGAIRTALTDLGISAVFCVQGVPTIAILSMKEEDRERIINVYGALWNQGLASLLLVITDTTLRAFSLARKPYKEWDEEFNARCLFQTLNITEHALEIRNIIYGAESGRLWKEYAEYFQSKERIDEVLLENLIVSFQELYDADLPSDAAQVLLIQTMFIAYLEDRGIITSEYFRNVSDGTVNDFLSLLTHEEVHLFEALFDKLRVHFNGDLFVAPCSFDSEAKPLTIRSVHLEVLARFRDGRVEMGAGGGQYSFWGYNFRYIPIALISAVYDHFLKKNDATRREQGAYYTPMFLADTVVSQVWDLLPTEVRENGRFLDPACGSGIFLARSFQRLCEHWRFTHKSQKIPWNSLLSILGRLHGWDVNWDAVRVAVFSLYVALLEEVSPPDIERLIERGRKLPKLWGRNLVELDFFDTEPDQNHFEVIIGNPPWKSRHGLAERSSVQWCKEHNRPMPGQEDAWAFAWKALSHLSGDGIVAFLLPAMGFLHNHAKKTVFARQQFIREIRIRRIINFADLRFLLFEGADRPTALIVFGSSENPEAPYKFDYWTPKADLNVQIKRNITLSSSDKISLHSATTISDPQVFKRRLWMREPDAKLFNYLSGFSRLSDLVRSYKEARRSKEMSDKKWIIGLGFKILNKDRRSEQTNSSKESRHVGELPYLPIEVFQRLAQPISNLNPWPSRMVHRKGFEAGYYGPRILVSRGVETATMRLQATYVEAPLTFQQIIQAITVPIGELSRAKLLTALLNSRLAIWFAFHGTSSFGSDRPAISQGDLLRLPFPDVQELPEPQSAKKAARKLVSVVDNAVKATKKAFTLQNEGEEEALFRKIDRLAYDYFCLSDDEILLIEDTVESIMPAVHPSPGSFPKIWGNSRQDERRGYAETLTNSLKEWLQEGSTVSAQLEGYNADLGVLRLTMGSESEKITYREKTTASLNEVLSRISKHIHQPLGGNFQLMPDLRVFIGRSLYLVKPMQKRFWLRSTALADAHAIAMDLQDAVEIDNRRGQA